ncbi:MAG: hybrid sensor histidine kinase/response regulator, partial [Desulfobulbus propionicus]
MYLPVAHPDEEIAGECISDTLFQGGRILVVDDEPQIVSLQYQMLEHVGYEVVASTVSSEALELFRKESETFDLVVTDMGMPGLTGLELFEEMRNIRPDIKVLLCTGYSKQVTEENAMEIGLSGYLAKPF